MKKLIPLLFLAVLSGASCYCTHLLGGEISAQRLSPTSNTFNITLKVYLSGAGHAFGGQNAWLDFGDGLRTLVPSTQAVFMPEAGIAVASFSVIHTYSGFRTYQVTYNESTWNESIVNRNSSSNSGFHLHAKIVLDPFFAPGTPEFLIYPHLQATSGHLISIAMAATDPTDYRVVYQLIAPDGFRGLESARVDPLNGEFTWDTYDDGHFVQGNFAFGVKAIRVDQQGIPAGYSMRIFLIHVGAEASGRNLDGPQLGDNRRILIETGHSEDLRISATSLFVSSSQIEFIQRSELTDFSDAVQLSVADTTVNSISGKRAQLTLSSLPAMDRENPYNVVVRAKYATESAVYFHDFTVLFFTRDVVFDGPIFDGPIVNVYGNGNEVNNPMAYPNPVTHVLNFTVETIEDVIFIHDASGKRVSTKARFVNQLDVSGLKPGMYYLHSENGCKKIQTIIKK